MIRGISEDILRRVYDFSEMTNEELRCKFFQKLEECIELCNNNNDILDWIKNVGLEKEVNELLTIWEQDGTLAKLINVDLFNNLKTELSDKISSIKSELEQIVYVKPNGTDDTENIKSMLQKYKRLKLIDGVFNIKNVELPSNAEITASENVTINLIGEDGQPCLYSINKENIKISNLNFNGKMKDLYGLGVISIFNSNNCVIENNKFNNVYSTNGGGSSAIDIEGSNNCSIKGNYITNSGYGITLGSRVSGDSKLIGNQRVSINKYCDNNIIEQNYIHTTTMDGIFLSASLNTTTQDCEINNNIIRNNYVEGSGDLGIESSRSSNNCIIEGNTVIGSKGANIFVRGGNNNIVTNNVSSKAKGVTGSYYSGGIAVSQDFGTITSCIIKNNECFNNIGEGIMVGIVSDKAIKISNNKCYNNDVGLGLGTNAKGCRVLYNEIYNNNNGIDIKYGTSNVAAHVVKFNSIYDNSNVGIVVNGERNNIQFNDVVGNEIGVSSDTGTTCNFNIIKNNDLTGNTTNLKLNGNGTSNIYINNDGVTDEPKILLSNKGKGYINEVYIDSSTNQLCWNKDGSIKKVILT